MTAEGIEPPLQEDKIDGHRPPLQDVAALTKAAVFAVMGAWWSQSFAGND
jgi:hypothetical protein